MSWADHDPVAGGLTRRGVIVLGGSVIAAHALRAPLASAVAGRRASAPATVPTFESVVGFPNGAAEATNAQLDDYVDRVAAASPRVRVGTLDPGTSVGGRPLRFVVVSDPANLADLAHIEARTRALRLSPPGTAAAAKAARELPAIVDVIANVHGNEPSGSDALARLLYELAARDDAANLQRLQRLMIVLVLVQNPDGREAQRRVNANEFDLNRDWFAFTQPETVGKVKLFSRFPPVLGIDMHEQFASAPGTFFFPPDNDPVHHESSRAGLKASNETFTPAMQAAYDAKGYSYEHYGIYDVFYPGYGDIAPNQAFGAAGVIFEAENSTPYPGKTDRQFVAADAAITAAAQHKEALLTAWAAQWPEAAAQGRAGLLAPNITQNPASPKALPVGDERVYGYALRMSRHAADAAHLVGRLRAFDVQVHVARRAVKLRRLRPFGETAFAPATLGRGTVIVTAAQPMKHWIHILLADDPFPAVNYFYDVAGWANPAIMGLSGGAIGEPLAALLKRPRRTGRQIARRARPRLATLRAVDSAQDLQHALRPASAYAFAVDAALAQAAAFALIAAGVDVQRTTSPLGELPAGTAIVPGGARATLAATARRFGIRPKALSAPPAGLEAARRPRVAVLHDAGADASAVFFATSSGFAGWLVRDRFGLPVTRVRTADIEAGALASGVDALIVPDGLSTVIPAGMPNVSASPPGGGLSPAGLANVQRFVAGGGTFIGYRTLGVAIATAAGIAGDLRTKPAPSGFTVPGGPVAVEVLDGDPATRGVSGRSFVYNVSDPILEGGEKTIVRYPGELRSLAYAEQLDAVNGTVAGTVAHVGSGSAHVFSFDPAYRGYVEATQRLVGNVLLAPPPGAGGSAARDVRPELLASTIAPARTTVVRVAGGAADVQALRDAVAAVASTPADAVLETMADGALQVRAIDPDPLSGHAAAWQQELLGRLARAGVRPTLIVA